MNCMRSVSNISDSGNVNSYRKAGSVNSVMNRPYGIAAGYMFPARGSKYSRIADAFPAVFAVMGTKLHIQRTIHCRLMQMPLCMFIHGQ